VSHILYTRIQSHRPVIRRKLYTKKTGKTGGWKKIQTPNSNCVPTDFDTERFIFYMGMFRSPTWGGNVSILLSLYAKCLYGCVWSFEYHYVCCESSSGPTLKLFCLWSPFVSKSHWFVTKSKGWPAGIYHLAKRNTDDHPSYFFCPGLFVAVGKTSYGIWVEFIGSTYSLHYLFIYLYLWCKVYSFPVT
jgi:hypothetical protein